jgi:hypothetical protein
LFVDFSLLFLQGQLLARGCLLTETQRVEARVATTLLQEKLKGLVLRRGVGMLDRVLPR